MRKVTRDFSTAFAAAMKTRRQRKGMSLARLAAESGLTQTYPGRVESGERSPTVDVAYAVAQALGCSFSDLVKDAEKLIKRKKQH